MKIETIIKALGLTRDIVGIKFLVYRKEYDESNGVEEKSSLCKMLSRACSGERVKADGKIQCINGAAVVGLEKVTEDLYSGRKDMQTGAFQSFAVAREISATRKYIPYNFCGIEMAPVENMEDPDLVVIIGTAKDIMRVMQGYANRYGMPKNLLTLGIAGVCSDLIAKPFMNNEVNISLLSRNARKEGDFSCDEMGISMPVHLFYETAEGILNTVNLTETNQAKCEIEKRLAFENELGFLIKKNYDYGKQGKAYRLYCEQCIEYENRYKNNI